jgi:hypothetical protein
MDSNEPLHQQIREQLATIAAIRFDQEVIRCLSRTVEANPVAMDWILSLDGYGELNQE